MAYGSSPSIQRPPRLPDQIHHQLAERLIQELDLLADEVRSLREQVDSDVASAPVTAGWKRPDRRVLARMSSSEVSATLEKGEVDSGIVAVLDSSGLRSGARETESSARQLGTSTPRSTSKARKDEAGDLLPLLRPAGSEDQQVPLIPLRDVIPPELHASLSQGLEAVLACLGEPEVKGAGQTDHLALRTWAGDREGTLGVPLFVALWRLRLWLGAGWEKATVSGR